MIAILLATYNGEEFLREQLDSLLSQSLDDFTVYIRDDGSTDSTLGILGHYCDTFPGKFILIESRSRIGPQRSFEVLMQCADKEEYLFFCDQDDVWMPDKLRTMIAKFEGDKPQLVVCDLSVIDPNGEVIEVSYNKKYGVSQNAVADGFIAPFFKGCAMCFNRAARDLYFKLRWHHMHDYVMYVSCLIYGEVRVFEQSLMDYRLHAQNTIGDSNQYSKSMLFKDFAKYLFHRVAYLDVRLHVYYRLREALASVSHNEELIGLPTRSELLSMKYFERKRWYYRSYKPLHFDFWRGIVDIFLI